MKTKKQAETEKYVIDCITNNKYVPSYEEVGQKFNISKQAAWFRLKNIRTYMKQGSPKIKKFILKDFYKGTK